MVSCGLAALQVALVASCLRSEVLDLGVSLVF